MSKSGELILKIFAGICVAVYAWMVVGQLFNVVKGIGGIFNALRFGVPMMLAQVVVCVVNVLTLAAYLWMLAALLLIILKRTQENSDALLTLTIGGVAVIAVVKLVAMLVSVLVVGLFSRRIGYSGVNTVMAKFKDLLLCTLGGAVAAGGAYGILRLVLGENPLVGKDIDTLLNEAKALVASLTARANAAAQNAKAGWEAQRQTQQAQAPAGQPPVVYSAGRLKTNRGLLMYILLNIVTFGIYSCFFIHALARDVNTACEGDGNHTAGLLKFVLLSFITCGIYSWVWYYGLGNRLAANAPRYGLNFQENGTTILLWMLIGALLCGIGPLVALHIICKNANALCGAYNARQSV